jgi:hypothetical protein
MMTVVGIAAGMHQRAVLACDIIIISSSSSGGISAARAAAAALASVNLHQQQPPQSSSWQALATVAVLPTMQQLLLLLEAALLHPTRCCEIAVDILLMTVDKLRVRGCLEAAVAELLPPVLQQLSLAVHHVATHPEQLDGPPERICSGYAALVGALLLAGESRASALCTNCSIQRWFGVLFAS